MVRYCNNFILTLFDTKIQQKAEKHSRQSSRWDSGATEQLLGYVSRPVSFWGAGNQAQQAKNQHWVLLEDSQKPATRPYLSHIWNKLWNVFNFLHCCSLPRVAFRNICVAQMDNLSQNRNTLILFKLVCVWSYSRICTGQSHLAVIYTHLQIPTSPQGIMHISFARYLCCLHHLWVQQLSPIPMCDLWTAEQRVHTACRDGWPMSPMTWLLPFLMCPVPKAASIYVMPWQASRFLSRQVFYKADASKGITAPSSKIIVH